MTLLVSSYNASFAPGTFLSHSGDSLKASSALHALDTMTPDHVAILFCPANVRGAMRRAAIRQRKKRPAVSSVLTDWINAGSLSFLNPVLYAWIVAGNKASGEPDLTAQFGNGPAIPSSSAGFH